MTFQKLSLPFAALALAGALSACSNTTESLETTDVFAPAAEVAVPAPAFDQQFVTAPPPIQNFVDAPAPIIAPPAIEAPAFVQAPVPIEAPALISVPAPIDAAPAFDCSVVPASKSGLALYRANCL